jgi:hypothetical protein
LFHYTDGDGFNGIRAQPIWVFKAAQPAGDHPRGAYFTTLGPDTGNLAKRLRVPKAKIAFVFCFVDGSDLIPLPGGRGAFIFYSRDDYEVERESITARPKKSWSDYHDWRNRYCHSD